ncbi:MAG TPA: HlyD family efflux transporter periplasmic adaptor subunit [Thermoanaerobaculia bacterium]|jgi:HlyD family secretion protein
MDRPIEPEVRRNRNLRRVAIAVLSLAAVTFLVHATVKWLRPSIARRDVELARVEIGSVDASLQASGTIVPAFEQVVSSPVDARVLRILHRAGDHVHAGDELVALDTSAAKLDTDRLADSVAAKLGEQAELKLRIEENLATLRAQAETKKLDRDILQFKAQENATLAREGLVSSQDNLAAAASLKKSEIELQQLGEALARARRTGDAQLASITAAIATLQRERQESQRQLSLAMMGADRGGVITSIVEDAGAALRKGDVVARIADLSSYRVAATISDLHASELAPGMRVRVKLDDTTSIGGAITSIDPRVENGSVRFWIALDERSHPKLRNNVRADVFVLTSQRSNALRVKRGSLGNSAVEDVFVLRGGDLVRTQVRWGVEGESALEVASGLRAGDQIAINNMSDYSGVDRLRID